MKQNRIELAEELLAIVMNHCFALSLTVSLLSLFEAEQISLLFWSSFVLVPVFLYVIRKTVRNFFLFYGVHLILPCLALLLPVSVYVKALAFFMVLTYSAYSIRLEIKTKDRKDHALSPFLGIPLLAVLLFIGNYIQNGLETQHILTALFYLACFFLYHFITSYFYFMATNESSTANTMERGIFTSGIKQTLLFTLGGVFILLLTCNLNWMSGIVSFLGNGILRLLRVLFSLLSFKNAEEIPEEILEEETRPEGLPEQMAEATDPSIFAIILEKLIFILFCIAIFAAILYIAKKMYRFLQANFYAGKRMEAPDLDSRQDVREKCTLERTRKTGRHRSLFLSNREKIRRLYRNKMLKNKWSLIGNKEVRQLEHMTAAECCEKLSEDALRKAYEKARYSPEKITGEDVRLAK